MAKRKAVGSAKPKSTPSSKPRSAASDGASSPAGGTSSGARPISHVEIGHAAGEIWSLLSNSGEQTLAAIKKSVDASPEIVLAAIGWLAREDKLDFSTSGRTVKISLR